MQYLTHTFLVISSISQFAIDDISCIIKKGEADLMKKVNKGVRIWIFIMIGMVALGSTAWVLDRTINSGNTSQRSIGFNNLSDPYISILYVEGVISSTSSEPLSSSSGSYNHWWLIEQIDNMIYDDANKGLVLFIDSPGGGVYETDELYLKVKEYVKLTDRPVYAALGSVAASGGYYTALAAESIYANRNTLTGSIGITMGTIYDISGFLERYGIKATAITSGRNKAMGDMSQPLTDEQKAIFQSIADDAYAQFVGIVAEERNMELEKAVQLADGRIYTARQAKELALIDEIGTLNQALSDMKSKYNLLECTTRDVYYVDDSFFSKIMQLQTNIQIPGELGSVLKLSGQNEQMMLHSPINYYCQF